MNICNIHNKINKTHCFILGELVDNFIPDNEVSLGRFMIDLISITIILPVFIVFGILYRIYSKYIVKYNTLKNITFKCKRNNKEEIYDR